MTTATAPPTASSPSRTATRILVVDDDLMHRNRTVRAFHARGHEAIAAENGQEAMTLAGHSKFDRAVLDLRMPDTDGLSLAQQLMQVQPDLDIVILTGYGSIPLAVEAIRIGVIDVLTKPADADQILLAFEGDEKRAEAAAETPGPYEAPTLDKVEWEHIQRVLSDCGGNITKTARVLGIHRRSLQRKLQRYAPHR
ncbi:MAG: response regulator [Planctomycetota bacterium]